METRGVRTEAGGASDHLDCLLIGYYEPPFGEYERLIRRFGEASEAYRDLRYSFVELDGVKRNYIDLLNHVVDSATGRSNQHRPTFISGEVPNLAASYLCDFLERRGLRADYVNVPAYEQQHLAALLDRRPACVAITTTFYVVDEPVIDVVKLIRRYDASVPIVVGGPLISNHFRRYRSRSNADASTVVGEGLGYALKRLGADVFVIDSQGESTLAAVATSLTRGESLRSVRNIAYFEGDRLNVSSAEPEENRMDDNTITWSRWPRARLGPTIQMRTARSCAFSCAFCNYPTRAGALALASIEAVARELDSISRVGGVKNVVFIDDTFNVPLPRFKSLCRLMIDRQYGLNWFSYLRCANIDAEGIELMARSGCKGVFLGIESGSGRILQRMNKAATPERYAAGLTMLREHGILTFGSFIAGFPGETRETLEETCEFIERTKPDYYRMQLWYCEQGTPIERERERHGIVGQGFKWTHSTMGSREAMDGIDRVFRRVTASAWLPQWSFDFWIIPYVVGKGLSLEQFKEFMSGANRLLALDLSCDRSDDAENTRRASLQNMIERARGWRTGHGEVAS